MKKSKENKGFELAKPMNLVQMSWSKGMTPMQIKAIHIVTMNLKKWIMNTNFEPNPELGSGIDAYRGIKTSFEMSIDEFAAMMQTSKKALKTTVKDADGNVVLLKKFPKLRIMEYFEEVQKVQCKVNSEYITGSFYPLPTAIYDKKNETVRLETTQSMAVILQDEAFAKNLSFVDMQLQLSLNSVMASHILDRISRFKTYNKNYQCTIGDLVDQCGIDPQSMKNRTNFIIANLTRPLQQIEKRSNGVWERIGTGAKVTAKKRGTLLREDEITFTMKYNKPENEPVDSKGWVPPSMDDGLLTMIGHITEFAFSNESNIEFPEGYLTKFITFTQDPETLEAVGINIERLTTLYIAAGQKVSQRTN